METKKCPVVVSWRVCGLKIIRTGTLDDSLRPSFDVYTCPKEHQTYHRLETTSLNSRREGLSAEPGKIQARRLTRSRRFSPHHRTRNAPSFISSAWPVDLSKRNRKSAPPCSHAMLIADFILLARTMNLEDVVVMAAKCDNVCLSHSRRKIARNRGRARGA